jgi:cystathionine beta-lyase
MTSKDTQFDRAINRRGTGSMKWDRYAGRDVLPMWVADMDFASPPEVLEALHARVDHGVLGYTDPYQDVIEAVIEYLEKRHGLAIDPDWIVWTPGMVPALNMACRAFAEAGEAVMTSSPVYPPFLSCAPQQGRELQLVPLVPDGDNWAFDFDRMRSTVTSRTRMLILCSPHNPVARVWRRDELDRLSVFCEENDLVLCSDEIHCDLVLDDVPHIASATLESAARQNIVTMMSPSKTYNIAGLSCAYAIIPGAKRRAQFQKAVRGIFTEINVFGYAGCSAAYRHGEPWRIELIRYLRSNRDYLLSFLRDRIPEIRCGSVQATYLAWFDVRQLGLEDPGAYFMDHGVALSDGRDFGSSGFVRLNFGCPFETLREGLHRLEAAVGKLRKSDQLT